MSWCELIISKGYDCFEFGFITGIYSILFFIALISFIYFIIIYLRKVNQRGTKDEN